MIGDMLDFTGLTDVSGERRRGYRAGLRAAAANATEEVKKLLEDEADRLDREAYVPPTYPVRIDVVMGVLPRGIPYHHMCEFCGGYDQLIVYDGRPGYGDEIVRCLTCKAHGQYGYVIGKPVFCPQTGNTTIDYKQRGSRYRRADPRYPWTPPSGPEYEAYQKAQEDARAKNLAEHQAYREKEAARPKPKGFFARIFSSEG